MVTSPATAAMDLFPLRNSSEEFLWSNDSAVFHTAGFPNGAGVMVGADRADGGAVEMMSASPDPNSDTRLDIDAGPAPAPNPASAPPVLPPPARPPLFTIVRQRLGALAPTNIPNVRAEAWECLTLKNICSDSFWSAASTGIMLLVFVVGIVGVVTRGEKNEGGSGEGGAGEEEGEKEGENLFEHMLQIPANLTHAPIGVRGSSNGQITAIATQPSNILKGWTVRMSDVLSRVVAAAAPGLLSELYRLQSANASHRIALTGG